MPEVRTEYGCPLCQAQIVASSGSLQCSKDPGHRWNDTAEFIKAGPKKLFTVAAATFAPQTSHVPVKVLIPMGVKQALESKLGDKMDATVAGVLAMMAEGEILMIPESDLQRYKERLGKRPESASELFGMVYALSLQAEDAKLEATNARQDIKAYEGLAPGRVVIDLGDQFQPTMEKARSAEEPLKVFVERNLRTALENNWF